MQKNSKIWASADVNFLTINHSKMTNIELSEVLNRSIRSVYHKRLRLGLGRAKRASQPNAWPEKYDKFLLQNPHMRIEDVAKTVRRTNAAVAHRRKMLGVSISKSETSWKDHEIQFLKENPEIPTAMLSERLDRTRIAVMLMRRKLGLIRERHDPWSQKEEIKLRKNISLPLDNLYKLFPNRTYASVCAKARKMNRKRHRRKGYSITPKGYIEITVKGRRILEHIYVMEQIKRHKLEKGKIVHHIDCNKANNSFNNLDLLQSNSQHQATHNSFRRLLKHLLNSGHVVYNFDKYGYEVGKS